MKEKMIKVAIMIGYLLFFVLMNIWVIAIQNSFNTMESLSYGFYSSRFWGMMLINFLKWFILGFLLHFMSKSGKMRLKVDLIYLAIALIWAVIYFMIHLGILVPMPTIIYSEKFMTQLICLIPILSGFFMFEGLLAAKEIENSQLELTDKTPNQKNTSIQHPPALAFAGAFFSLYKKKRLWDNKQNGYE